MVKKQKDAGNRKKQKDSPDCDLDGGYCSPIKTVRDVSVENIKLVFIHSRYAQILLSLTIFGIILRFYQSRF